MLLVFKLLQLVPGFISLAEKLFSSKPKNGLQKAEWVRDSLLDGLNLAGITSISGVPLSAMTKLQQKITDAIVEFFNENNLWDKV